MAIINRLAEVRAYKYLRKQGMSHAGAIGLICNLEAESDGFYTNRMEYLLVRRLKEAGYNYTDESYAAAIDSGKITLEEYMHPLPGKQYGHGLAQWTSPGRKKLLYERAKVKKVSITDENLQLEYLIWELKNKYQHVWKVLTTVTSIRTASDYFLVHFEAPANTGETVRKGRADRGYVFEKYLKCQNGGTKMKVTAQQIIDVMKSWIGMSRSKGTHKPIIDLYNSHKPLARGYAVSYTDDYCDTTVSAAFIKLDAVDLIGGTECGVEEHINILKAKGIWNEDGTIVPKPGYIICYNWDDATQPNDGWADHIGIVESVNTQNRTLTVIEGNMSGGVVGERTIPIGWGYIRGYGCPKYTDSSGTTTGNETSNKKDYLSKGDNGPEVNTMQTMLITVGYPCGSSGADGDFGAGTEKALKNYQKDHKLEPDGCYGSKSKASLEALYKKAQAAMSQPATTEAAQSFNKVKAGAYKTTSDLWMRAGAGKEKSGILVVPKGKTVQCYGYYSTASDKTAWLYVVYNGKTGFCSSKYLKKC